MSSTGSAVTKVVVQNVQLGSGRFEEVKTRKLSAVRSKIEKPSHYVTQYSCIAWFMAVIDNCILSYYSSSTSYYNARHFT